MAFDRLPLETDPGPTTAAAGASVAQSPQQRLVQRKIQRRALQRRGGALAVSDPALAASLAPSSSGSPLPEGPRRSMESSFGADFADVRVHEGAAPARIGAVAYTQGNDLHFSPGSYSPESSAGRELLGHELAHVVQQRQGRVAGAQGKEAAINCDPALEAEADEAGARAARGEPAGGAGSTGATAALDSRRAPLQGFFKLNADQVEDLVTGDALGGHRFLAQQTGADANNPKSFTNAAGQAHNVRRPGIPPLRVSSDGLMAIEDSDLGTRQPKVFYIDPGLIGASNAELQRTGSTYVLSTAGGTLRVPDKGGSAHDLVRVVAAHASHEDTRRGLDMPSPVNCNEMAATVTGQHDSQMVANLHTGSQMELGLDFGNHMAAHITGYASSLEESRLHNQKRLRIKRSDKKIGSKAKAAGESAADFRYTQRTVNREVPTLLVRVPLAQMPAFELVRKSQEDRIAFRMKRSEAEGDVTYVLHSAMLIGQDPDADRLLLQGPPFAALIHDVVDGPDMTFGDTTTDQFDKQQQIADDYGQMDPQKRERAEEALGVNDHAAPGVGEAYMITSAGPVQGGNIHDVRRGQDMAASFPYHWGGVIARSGADTVTLENYARKDEDGGKANQGAQDPRAFFQMYGPASHVEPGSQSFHEFWSLFFANPVTAAFSNPDK